MRLGIEGSFLQKESCGACGIVLAGGGRFVAGEGKAGDFEKGLANHRGAKMGDPAATEPAGHEGKFFITTIAKEPGKKIDFLKARGRGSERFQKLAEITEVARRAGKLGFRRGFGGGRI